MKVLLIDDHAMFREGIALLLQPLVSPLETWEAGSCTEAFELLQRQGPADLVLIDIGLPGLSGLEGIARLQQVQPGVPVVALSSSDDRHTVMQALDAGAMGFVPKSSTSAILVGALRLILAGGLYLPPSVFLGGGERLSPEPATVHGRDDGKLRPPPAPTASSPKRPADLGLTPRQADVLHLLLQGKPAKLICRELDLSPSTVKAHTTAVLRALNVTTRTQAVIAASAMGLRFERVAAQPDGGAAAA